MKKIVKAVFMLSAFSIIDRALGFAFKIYLSRELGAAAMGVYQVALSVFFVLITVTTSGVPLVVSKLTAKYRALGDKKAENGVTSAALIVGLTASTLIAVVLFLFRYPLSTLFASENSMTLILLLLPALIFSSIYAAFRGNLWGRQKYTIVSLLELLEQIARMSLCVILFSFGFNRLNVTVTSLSIACGISAAACVLSYFVYKGGLASPKGHIIPLIKAGAPITVSRAASSVVNSIIAVAVPFLLISSGMKNDDAMYIFGYSVGMALPLLYIPLTVVGSLAFVMIPVLSTSIEKKDNKSTNRQIQSAISFSIISASIFLPFFLMLGKDIGMLVYDNADSGRFISMCAWLLIPLAVESITSSLMNSLDLEIKSFINYIIGAALTFAIMFAFYGRFNIALLSVGMGVSLLVTSFLHILCIRKKTGLGFGFLKTLLKCAVILVPASFLTKWTFNLTNGLPIVIKLAIAGITEAVFLISLCLVFELLDIDMFRSKKKQKALSR